MNYGEIEIIEETTGYAFKNKSLLERAFTHSSYANEHGLPSYERLEFLGDGVLGLIIAEKLYKGEGDEGVMTVKRSMIVSSEPLEDAMLEMRLDKYIMFGNGEKKQDHSDSKVLADVFEALLGAIYLDGGYAEACSFIERSLGGRINDVMVSSSPINYKGRLQEYCQARKVGPVVYNVEESVAEGRPYFTAEVRAAGVTAAGTGKRKRDAEQNAARSALEKLSQI